jgi:hypothetical protein
VVNCGFIEEKAELSGLMIERDIKQSFAFYTEKEETARQLRERQVHGEWDHINNRNSGKKNTPLLGKVIFDYFADNFVFRSTISFAKKEFRRKHGE